MRLVLGEAREYYQRLSHMPTHSALDLLSRHIGRWEREKLSQRRDEANDDVVTEETCAVICREVLDD